MADKKITKEDVIAAWEQDDQKGFFDLVETKTVDGEPDQLHLINKSNGSLVVAVNAGDDALQRLYDNPRVTNLDPGRSPKAAVEDGEARHTSTGALATPTHPEDLKTFEGLGELDPDTLNSKKD